MIEDFITMEELFYGVEDLTPRDAMSWVRFKTPSLDPNRVGGEAEIILGLYGLWKEGLIFIEGDKAGFYG